MNKKLIVALLGVIALIGLTATVVKGDTFLPVVVKDSNIETTAPTHVLVVFSTTATTHGIILPPGGITGMNTMCTNEDPASHFCSVYEIENAMATTGVYFKSRFQNAWVNNPQLSLIPKLNNTNTPADSNWGASCGGWEGLNGPGDTGPFIKDDATGVAFGICNQQLIHVTCCKWNP